MYKELIDIPDGKYILPQYNIIALGGRKESGKSELAKICMKHGYEKISFATPLKTLTCKILHLESIEALNSLKNSPMDYLLTEEDYQTLSDACGAPIEFCKEHTRWLNGKSTGRDWLQIIGTELIRNWNAQWHVEQTLKMMVPGKKYVIDDLRFPNELEALKKMNAECWFVIRTKVDNISHHASEEMLSFSDFDPNVIVNDGSLFKMTIRWKIYMDTHVETSMFRKSLLENQSEYNDVMESYFIYPETKNLKEIKASVHHIMKTHKLKPNFYKNGFIVTFNGVDMWEETNPFRIEAMKYYYNEGEA